MKIKIFVWIGEDVIKYQSNQTCRRDNKIQEYNVYIIKTIMPQCLQIHINNFYYLCVG